MVQHGKFLGEMEINGSTEQLILYVFMPDECMSISDVDFHENGKHHRQFLFSPFTRGMFVTHNANDLSRGRYFELSGTSVGTVSEGRSAPYGEGEWDVRNIQTVRLDVAYSQNGMAVTISGITMPGTTVTIPGSSNAKPLSPWQFKIQFDIPRADLKDIFALNDLGSHTLNQVIGQHAKHSA